jgi:hypothetical protein
VSMAYEFWLFYTCINRIVGEFCSYYRIMYRITF